MLAKCWLTCGRVCIDMFLPVLRKQVCLCACVPSFHASLLDTNWFAPIGLMIVQVKPRPKAPTTKR
jgi:hypothetical protein